MPHILIIDDDPGMREALEQNLESAGHKTLQAADGRQALQVMRHTAPDLILLDLLMPEMDGIELLQSLQGKPRPKIIAMSGAPEGWNVLHVAQKMGATRTLAKPFTPTDVLRAVETVLASA